MVFYVGGRSKENRRAWLTMCIAKRIDMLCFPPRLSSWIDIHRFPPRLPRWKQIWQPETVTTAKLSTDAMPPMLQLKIRVDVSCRVFLNGQECHRWNMPKGAFESETVASAPLSAPQEALVHLFYIAADRLRPGRNVIAVEVHQCNLQVTHGMNWNSKIKHW